MAGSLSDENRRAMIAATHDTAHAMVDDIGHIREIVNKPEPTPGDIRRISNQLRRLLIDNMGDLRKIAPPRIGALHLNAPDILALYRSGKKRPFEFLSAGMASIFGFQVDAIMLETGNFARNVPGYTPETYTSLKLDGFLNQNVLCYQGQWATRADVIKYIANVAHGVHSGDAKEQKHELLKKIRYAVAIKMVNGMPQISANSDIIVEKADPEIRADREAIDIVLLQLMSAAQYLVTSSDINKLEQIIKAESPN